MTSDAKIGLLLGLVFIFVIAFIINGLPNFGSNPQGADAAQAATFDSDDLGDLVGETGSAGELLGYSDLMGEGLADETPAYEEPAVELPEPQPSLAESEGINEGNGYRTILALDEIGSGLSEAWRNATRELAELGGERMTMQNPAEEPMPASGTLSGGSHVLVPRGSGSDRVMSPLSDRTPPTLERTTVRGILNRTYTVKEGDVLATVAKNVYGPVEGNRLVNIKRIYEANTMVLKSPDEIFVGQTLIIPPLPDAAQQTGVETPNPTLSESLFEHVESVGRRNLPEPQQVLNPGERWYTVEEGDSLWKIASRQLGSGARCDEIAAMNVDTLKNRDTLNIGMKLRLPLN